MKLGILPRLINAAVAFATSFVEKMMVLTTPPTSLEEVWQPLMSSTLMALIIMGGGEMAMRKAEQKVEKDMPALKDMRKAVRNSEAATIGK